MIFRILVHAIAFLLFSLQAHDIAKAEWEDELHCSTKDYFYPIVEGQRFSRNHEAEFILSGDVNRDGKVDSSDAIPLKENMGKSVHEVVCADENADGLIDEADLRLIEERTELGGYRERAVDNWQRHQGMRIQDLYSADLNDDDRIDALDVSIYAENFDAQFPLSPQVASFDVSDLSDSTAVLKPYQPCSHDTSETEGICYRPFATTYLQQLSAEVFQIHYNFGHNGDAAARYAGVSVELFEGNFSNPSTLDLSNDLHIGLRSFAQDGPASRIRLIVEDITGKKAAYLIANIGSEYVGHRVRSSRLRRINDRLDVTKIRRISFQVNRLSDIRCLRTLCLYRGRLWCGGDESNSSAKSRERSSGGYSAKQYECVCRSLC